MAASSLLLVVAPPSLSTANDFINLRFAPIEDLTSSADVIDDRALGFAGLSSYTVTGAPSGTQHVSITSSSGTFSFDTTGSDLSPGNIQRRDAWLRHTPVRERRARWDGHNRLLRPGHTLGDTRRRSVSGKSEAWRSSDDGCVPWNASQPVKWIGRRRINLAAHPRPETVAPVRIARGAFSDNMPHRDLWLSPDHAVFVDGKLIGIRQLVNGTTIRQDMGATAVEYYHVEMEQHTILAAEGLPDRELSRYRQPQFLHQLRSAAIAASEHADRGRSCHSGNLLLRTLRLG